MEPTFEEFLAAQQGRSPAGSVPLMLAPEVLNAADPRAAFVAKGAMPVAAPSPTPSPTPKLTLTPAAKAALKKKMTPAAKKPAEPAEPAAPPSTAQELADEYAAVKKPGMDPKLNQIDETKLTSSNQEKRPFTYTNSEIDGRRRTLQEHEDSGNLVVQSFVGYNPDGTPKFEPRLQGAIGPALKTLKGQLGDYQEARAGNAANAELRAKLAPYAAGQMSLAPLLSYINSMQGTKIQEAPDRAPGAAQQFIKNEADAQDDRLKLAALENKLIDQVSIPQGSTLVTGSGSGEKTNITISPTPPPPVGRAPAKPKDWSKDVRELGKALRTWAPSAANDLTTLDTMFKGQGGLKGMLSGDHPQIPGTDTLSKILPIGWVSDDAAKLKQTLTRIARQRLQLRSGQAASDKETQSYLQDLGVNWKSSPRESATGIRSLLTEFRDTVDATYAGFDPEVVRQYRSHPGAVTPEAFGKFVPEEGKKLIKTQTNPKTGQKREVYSDGSFKVLP